MCREEQDVRTPKQDTRVQVQVKSPMNENHVIWLFHLVTFRLMMKRTHRKRVQFVNLMIETVVSLFTLR